MLAPDGRGARGDPRFRISDLPVTDPDNFRPLTFAELVPFSMALPVPKILDATSRDCWLRVLRHEMRNLTFDLGV